MAEVAQHHRHDDAWCVIHGKVYDIGKFASVHPGGDIILLAAGRDATILFESYHISTKPEKILPHYLLGECVDHETSYEWSGSFYSTMKQRVHEYFEASKRNRRFSWTSRVKTVLIMSAWILSYYFTFIQGNYLTAIIFGFSSALIGTCIMHDGSHGSYSNRNTLNKLARFGMDLISSSSVVWEFQHIVGHHSFTNSSNEANHESDPDIFSAYPLLRLHPTTQAPKFHHRFQHIYAPFIFALMTMSKVFAYDFVCVLRSVAGIPMTSRFSDPRFLTLFVAAKTISISYSLLIPLWLHGWYALVLLAIAHACCGEFLALMFIVTHVNAQCEFPTNRFASKKSKTHGNWAEMQVKTSVNWDTNSYWWTQISGGLNHQIEHHLFPGICHTHYPSIRPIVQQTCNEFNVPYRSESSLLSAITSMLGFLKKIGNGTAK